MTSRSFRPGLIALLAVSCVAGLSAQSQSTRDPASGGNSAKSTPASSSTAARTGRPATGKGPLPDPTLLDGSALPAEKKSEQGMLGDFELPGDENSRSGKVGGPQQPMPQGASGGGQPMPPGMPPVGGGGAQAQQMPAGQPPAGAQQAGGGGAPDNQAQQQGGGGAAGGPNDPNAKAEGAQVGHLQTDPDAGPGGTSDGGQKPQQVSIGDKAMQIKGVANAAGAVGGAVPAGQTQQMEKAVGGGKGSSAISGGRNAAEKGRAIPAGL